MEEMLNQKTNLLKTSEATLKKLDLKCVCL